VTKKKRSGYVTRLRNEVESLKWDNQGLKRENAKMRYDLVLLQGHFVQRWRWWIDLLKNRKVPDIAALIENDAWYIARLTPWDWEKP
jgi:hypothetical protein